MKETKDEKEQESVVFHHSLPIQLRWNDADQFGHINNTLYFQYYDMAKMDYFANIPKSTSAMPSSRCMSMQTSSRRCISATM